VKTTETDFSIQIKKSGGKVWLIVKGNRKEVQQKFLKKDDKIKERPGKRKGPSPANSRPPKTKLVWNISLRFGVGLRETACERWAGKQPKDSAAHPDQKKFSRKTRLLSVVFTKGQKGRTTVTRTQISKKEGTKGKST